MIGSPESQMADHPDFSVVVKSRGRLPSPWRWEIYRSGRKSPVKQSEIYFSTVAEANRAPQQLRRHAGWPTIPRRRARADVIAFSRNRAELAGVACKA